MNTDKDSLLAILQPYRVAVDMQENDRTVFWHVREESGDPAMELTLQTVNDENIASISLIISFLSCLKRRYCRFYAPFSTAPIAS